jgi:hypothetical protein
MARIQDQRLEHTRRQLITEWSHVLHGSVDVIGTWCWIISRNVCWTAALFMSSVS